LALGELLERIAPDVVAVECAEGGVFQPFRAKYLLASQFAGGILAGLALAQGIELVTTSAQTWRKEVLGSLKRGQNYDEVIARVLPAMVEGFQSGNVHTRDATGIALWAALQPAARTKVAGA